MHDDLPTLLLREEREGVAGMSIRMSAIFVLMRVSIVGCLQRFSQLCDKLQNDNLCVFFLFC
jgi:hypothetical protein